VITSELPKELDLSRPPEMRYRSFLAFLLLLVGATVVRSVLATRHDDFTLDEPYHIAAGVSYVQYGDFRLNPEHPPLVKLWVGSLLSMTGFRLRALRQFQDKPDERRFTEENVFLQNDPDSVQRRSRAAMWTLNGLLLIALALALRRSFGSVVTLGAMLFLAIDPTVAAHLPVVMTDLPVALLCATTVVLAARAFRSWTWPDLALCSAALGLALGTKHSAPIFYVFVALTGSVFAVFVQAAQRRDTRLLRLAKLFCVLLGAVVILWGLYFFRFRESGTHNEAFNRPLAAKIGDLSSPAYRFVLTQMAAAHLVPRAYVWGFADTVHAGLEGRAFHQLAFGHLYYAKAPWYFFPGVIAIKLPIGLILLALSGLFAFLTGRFPRDWNLSAAVLLAGLLCFFFTLSRGATYAGIRHALPAVPFLAILAGMSAHIALTAKAKVPKILVALAFLAAAASALPVSRPWEYFNETLGHARDAWFYFDDEGIDMSQRGKELASYYHQVIQPSGDVPYITYNIGLPEREARDLDWLGRDLTRDETRMSSGTFSGTIFISTRAIARSLWWDLPSLREATPTARFGNMLVFRGTFDLRGRLARNLYSLGIYSAYAEKPDSEAAERLLRESAAADPRAFFVHIELGNIAVKRGSRHGALQAYGSALEYAPDDPILRRSIQDQIRLLSMEPLDRIPPLRNPALE
jgi:tetratricopeptide (TPR) repeat protein